MMGSGHMMAEGGHMMPGLVGMGIYGLVKLVVVVLFLWLFYRLVRAAERLTKQSTDQS